jgi:hypothetical protein
MLTVYGIRERRMHGDQEWIFLSLILKRISHCAKVFDNYFIVFYIGMGKGGCRKHYFMFSSLLKGADIIMNP